MTHEKLFLRTTGVLFQIFILLVLPFFILLKGSVFLYEAYEWPWFFAMLFMALIDFVLLLIYVAMLYDSIIGPGKMTRRSIKYKSFVVIGIMIFFLAYSLFNLSGANAKGDDVRMEYTSLHPLLRLSVGTLVLFNSQLLITDMARGKEDYQKMGLKTKSRSLHYKQKDGFVHAMDLRTKGHSEIRNNLLKGYFWLMGFNTLRHVGTADHLHVSISSRDLPGAI